MKLREDFFDDDAIEWLEEQPKGKEYALFYLKLCLKSLKTNGLLIRTVGTILVPYDTKKLADITKTDYDTAIVAMELLKNIGLVEILETGEICLPRMEEMIGSETDKAVLMRKLRAQKNIIDGNNVTQMLPDSYRHKDGNNVTTALPECSENVTQRLENRDIEIDKNIIVAPSGNDTCDKRDKYPIGDFEYQCVDMLIQSCLSIFPGSKVPRSEKEKRNWAMEIERMKRLDKRSESDIIEALTYATTDGFWKSNIRSVRKFREKFETLIIQSRNKVARDTRETKQPSNRFHNFTQRETDYDSMVLQMAKGQLGITKLVPDGEI
ncbi:MAG: hypothetical protein HFG42_14225 [Lachnospiraceae bacterium]|nr:hypothetical protein [Lachnospiraceae bacterium]